MEALLFHTIHSLFKFMFLVEFHPFFTWHISKTIIDYLFLIVITCVLNQSNGHWLLSDVLNFIITMSLKLKEEVRINLALDSLMDDDPNVCP